MGKIKSIRAVLRRISKKRQIAILEMAGLVIVGRALGGGQIHSKSEVRHSMQLLFKLIEKGPAKIVVATISKTIPAIAPPALGTIYYIGRSGREN